MAYLYRGTIIYNVSEESEALQSEGVEVQADLELHKQIMPVVKKGFTGLHKYILFLKANAVTINVKTYYSHVMDMCWCISP